MLAHGWVTTGGAIRVSIYRAVCFLFIAVLGVGLKIIVILLLILFFVLCVILSIHTP
jgi:hypothetical protein